MGYCEILHKKVGQKAPSIIRGPLDPIFYPIDKANIIADCSENQFTLHDSHGYDHKWQVETRVYVLLAAADEDTPAK
jgi:hypothetical protein